MTDKQKNLVIRSITGVFFRGVHGILSFNPRAMDPVRPHYRIEHLGVLRIS